MNITQYGPPSTITTMQDVTLSREWDGASVLVTVYNDRESDWNMVDDCIAQGYTVDEVVEVG